LICLINTVTNLPGVTKTVKHSFLLIFLLIFSTGCTVLDEPPGDIDKIEAYGELTNYSSYGTTFKFQDVNSSYIVSFLSSGELKNVEFYDSPSRLITNISGIYQVGWSMSFLTANKSNYIISPAKNYNVNTNIKCLSEITTNAVLITHVSGDCFFNMSENDVITLEIQDKVTPAPNIQIYSATLTIEKVDKK